MEYSKDYFEGLPSDLRYWFCKYKSAVGDPYKTPLPLEEVLDRENKVELRKLREAVESLEQGGTSDLIDI